MRRYLLLAPLLLLLSTPAGAQTEAEYINAVTTGFEVNLERRTRNFEHSLLQGKKDPLTRPQETGP